MTRPALDTVAMSVDDDVQVARVVTVWADPPVTVWLATSWVVCPTAVNVVFPVITIDVALGAVEVFEHPETRAPTTNKHTTTIDRIPLAHTMTPTSVQRRCHVAEVTTTGQSTDCGLFRWRGVPLRGHRCHQVER